MNIFSFLFPKYKIDISKNIRLITLFSGYDSQKLAFDYLGIVVEHYRAIEFDKYALQSLNEIHNTNFETKDITKVSADELGIVDTKDYTYILTYSFPCTDLSLAGKRAGMDRESGTRSGLLWEVERLLKETKEKPQILIMENVPQVLSAKGWREWNVFLENLGYSNYAEILNSKDFGIPQNRERVFMVSVLGKYSYEFPEKIKLNIKLKHLLETTVNIKYFLSDKKFIYLNKKLNQGYKTKLLTDIDGISTCVCNPGRNQINDTYIIDFGSYFTWLDNQGNINTQCNRVANENGLALTVACANTGKVFLNYKYVRKLTPLECFKLMGVKAFDYNKITCSNSQKYKQAGNSIVTTVLMAIYSQLFENIDYKYYIDKLLFDLIHNR